MFSEVADDNMFDKPGEVWKAADGTGSSYVSWAVIVHELTRVEQQRLHIPRKAYMSGVELLE